SRVAEPWEKLYRDAAGHWRLMTQPRKDELGQPVTPEAWVQTREDPEVEVSFTVLQVGLFFSIYVFFQVWNQINCRSLTPETSGFTNLFANKAFLTIAGITAIGQILIITIGGAVFKVEPLGLLSWLLVLVGTASVLGFAEVARYIRRKKAMAATMPATAPLTPAEAPAKP